MDNFVVPSLFAICCLLVVPLSTVGFVLPKLWLFSLFALCGGLWLLRRRIPVAQLAMQTWPGRFFLLFLAAALLSFAWSTIPLVSLLGLSPRFLGSMTYGVAGLLALWAMGFSQTDAGRQTVLRCLVLSNAVVVIYGLLQLMHLDPLHALFYSDAFLGRIFSSLGHPSQLAHFILLTGPFVALRCFESKKTTDRQLYAALVLLNVLILLATASRGALLGLILTLMLVSRRYSDRIAHLTAKQQAITSGFIAALLVVGASSFASRFALGFEQGRSFGARSVIYQQSLNMIADRPAGYGLDTLSFYSSQFIGPELYEYESLSTVIDRAHNIGLDLWLGMGPLGLFFYALFIVLILRAGWQRNSTLAQIAVTSLLSFHVALLFSFPTVTTTMVMFVITGVLLGHLPALKKATYPLSQSLLLSVSFVTIALFSLGATSQWLVARVYQAKAEWHLDHDQVVESMAAHRQAVSVFPYDRTILLNAAETHLKYLELFNDPDASALTKQMIDQAHVLLRDRDGMAYLLDAWWQAIAGNDASAIAALNTGRDLLPSSVLYKRGEARVYQLLGDEQSATAAKQQIVRWLPPQFYTDSNLQRVVLKQHPWLTELIDL